jgi:adenylate cyclase
LSQRVARIAFGLAITLLLIGHAARWYPTADGKLRFVSQVDNFIYDARLQMTMPRGVDERIVILDIDEKSLGEIGRWPWSRDLMAELVDKLFERYGVTLLAFDVVWAEPDPSSGVVVLDRLARSELRANADFQKAYARLRPALDFDARFAASLKGRPVALGFYFNEEDRAVRINALPEPVLPKGTFADRRVQFDEFKGYTGNLPLYLANAPTAGHINSSLIDFDGVVRRVPLLLEFDGAYYESLSLAVVRTFLGLRTGALPRVEPELPPEHSDLEWLRVGTLDIPVDNAAAALIPFRGGKYSFRYVSLADLVHDRLPEGSLKETIAIVGASAPGLQDLRATPVDAVFPGVEIHANLIAGMLDGELKHKPLYVVGFEVLVLAVAGIALAWLVPRLSALWATLAVAAAAGILVGFNFWVWSDAGHVLPLAASLLMIAAIYTMNMAYGYFVESRSKQQLAGRFGQYVPPELVDRMAADPGKYSMAPRSAELSILFSDVRGFTSISESLKPEELRDYINEYLTEMSTVIRSTYRGTLDKYIGDAIMAFWGAPVDDPQHARNAVLAALAMQKQCEALNARFATRGWPTLKIGVGVNTGVVRVGDMGSQFRRAYTAMGDAVNIASRLEGRTKSYGVGILVGEATRNAVKDVVFREIDRVKVKGKDTAITIYEPLGLASELSEQAREEVALWHACLRAHRSREWDAATADLARLQRANACALYALMAQKIDQLRRNPPPPEWEGVTVFDDK